MYLSLQFKDPSTTSECLFSLLNGDDMFATYNEMSQASMAAWVFSKIYLYTFISLFIYVVLSVFISLISDTYETLHVSPCVCGVWVWAVRITVYLLIYRTAKNNYFGNCPGIIGTDFYRACACKVSGIIRISMQLHAS